MTVAPSSDVLLDRLLQLHPKLIDLTLDRVWRILAALGDPQNKIAPVIHVAGTNGKGSTLAMVRAGLEAAGERVNTYTSPHLVRFHERIRLGPELISEQHLASLLEECEQANDGTAITFFEITTAAALLAFARNPADYTLLEVGLGGRLDATNVIDRPAVTAITPVSIDHQQFLGETLREIAGEKAGILKRDVPCIVGPQVVEALEAIEEKAEQIGAPLRVHGRDWLVRTEHGRLVYQDEAGLLDLDPPRLAGAHQTTNAGTAIAILRELGASDSACQAALRDATWPARIQRLSDGALPALLPEGCELWLDGGHNAAAGEALAAVLDDWHARHPMPVHAVAGMLKTKSAVDFLRPLAPRIESLAAVAIPESESSFSADELSEISAGLGVMSNPAASIQAALSSVAERLEGPSRVLICGSLYLAGEVLRQNNNDVG